MKHLIRKILKEENLKQNLKQQVKDYGWKDAAELVGDGEILAKLGFNNDPVEFINLFNDLDVVQSEERQNLTLFRSKKGNNLMVYNRKTKYVHISYDNIWSVLDDEFNLDYSEIQQLTQEWLGEVYNLRGITTRCIWGRTEIWLGEGNNLKI